MTQTTSFRPSLNAVRAFEAAARLRSVKAAAEMLGVTPGAVSHQVRQLEQAMGTRLVSYGNNGIDLTPDGLRYFDAIHPGLISIERANRDILRNESRVTVRASTSFALAWLIPKLSGFRLAHPRVDVSVDACREPIALEHGVDVAISYARLGVIPSDATLLMEDNARLVCHPQRLETLRSECAGMATVKLLSGTESDWDLHQWAELNEIPAERLRVAARFDIDCAAVAACKAGLGVYLASDCLVESEMAQGALVPFGPYRPVHIGNYWIKSAKPSHNAAARFSQWLRSAIPR